MMILQRNHAFTNTLQLVCLTVQQRVIERELYLELRLILFVAGVPQGSVLLSFVYIYKLIVNLF